MLLAIDAGNTNLVFALVDEGRDQGALADRDRSAAHRRPICGVAASAARARRLSAVRCRRGDHRHGGSARAPQSRSAGEQIFPRRAADRGAGQRRPGRSQLDVDEPQNVGADRALNAIAAHAKHPGDLIVVDFGTATTFDVVDCVGRLQGRDHRAGHQPVARRAGQRRGQAPAHRDRGAARTISVIGRTTESQMLIGIYWGYVAMIEGLIERMKREIGRPVDGRRDRRARDSVRQAHRRVRRDRARPHDPGVEPAVRHGRAAPNDDPGRRAAVLSRSAARARSA